MGLSDDFCHQVAVAGMLHDIGKEEISGQIDENQERLVVEACSEILLHFHGSALGVHLLVAVVAEAGEARSLPGTCLLQIALAVGWHPAVDAHSCSGTQADDRLLRST